MLFPFLALLILRASAQRPDSASLCDYYAEQQFGANTSATQFQLVQRIVAFAFGGNFNLSNITSGLTGILNQGTFQDLSVNLRPYFDGSKATTNSNGIPLGVNWLDGGGLDPLQDYLNGTTSDVTISNSTNQYGLFARFFVSFAHVFGCSLPPKPPPTQNGAQDSSTLNVAYVHKFMDLNATDLGHFIDQLSIATSSVGFDQTDAQYLATHLNSMFNVRCAPPVQFPPNNQWELPSLCQDPTCPLAETDPDCDAYDNIMPNGVPSSAIPTATTSATSSVAQTSSPTIVSATSTAAPSATASSSTQASSPALSKGAIAGIAVGGVFALLLFVSCVSFLFRRKKKQREMVSTPHWGSPPNQYPAMHSHHAVPMYGPPGLSSPEMTKSPPAAEMESPLSSPRLTGGSMRAMSPPIELGGDEGRERWGGHWSRG